MMKYLRFAVASAAFFIVGPSVAQNSGAVPQYAVPIGKGAGTTGFGSAAPGTAGQVLVSNGSSANPTFQSVGSASFGAQNANKVFAGPATGADAAPTFRALVGADLPLPGASSLGGVKSLSATSNNFLTGLGTDGAFTRAQPAFSNLSGSATCAQLPALTGNVATSAGSCATTIGAGVVSNSMLAGSIAASKLIGTDIATVGTVTAGTWQGTKIGLAYGGTNADLSATGGTSQFLKQNTAGGAIVPTRPACADLSNAAASCSTDATNASNITSGSLPAARLPAGQLPATATNDNASAGNLGEYLSGTRVIGSAITLTTLTPANVTSVTLTAGDWDVRGNLSFVGGGTVSTLIVQTASLSATSATFDSTPGRLVSQWVNTDVGSSISNVVIGPTRFSIAAGTTVYLVCRASFSGNAVQAYGTIEARRVR